MNNPLLSLPKRTSLFVAAIREPSENDLRVIVVEGKHQSARADSPVRGAVPVEPDETSRAFEITWWGYVAHSVRNESYWRQEVGENVDGSRFGTRENSAFLRYVSETTFACADFPGPLVHWFLYTERHCIDVVSVDAPEVKEISVSQVVWDLGDRPS